MLLLQLKVFPKDLTWNYILYIFFWDTRYKHEKLSDTHKRLFPIYIYEVYH